MLAGTLARAFLPQDAIFYETSEPMIIVALGANLPSDDHGSPRETLEAALAALAAGGLRVLARSPRYESAPVPPSDQPWFVNGVAALDSALAPGPLLQRLHGVEAEFGRRRGQLNAARVLDLDLIDYQGRVDAGAADWPRLPHPRLAERAFVLLPLADVAPAWRHPHGGASLADLMVALPPDQLCRPLR